MMRSNCFFRRAVPAFTLPITLLVPIAAAGQSVVDPTTVEFVASADHSRTLPDGTPLVDRYDLQFYLIGAAEPFQTANLGKPTPGVGDLVRVNFTTFLGSMPTPGVVYQAKVAAVGIGGAGTSELSNTFSFSGSCSYTVTPTSAAPPAAGGTFTVDVMAGSGCTWTASETSSWLAITAGSAGSGNGRVTYTVAANPNASSRTATLTVAGQAVTVTQAARGAPTRPQGVRVVQPSN